MDRRTIIGVLILLAASLSFQQMAHAQFAIRSSVLGGGGSSMANNSFRMVGTLGQPLIGRVSNPSLVHGAGFWYSSAGLITSVEQKSTNVPTEYRLEQNYPNPFNPQTTIEFAVPRPSQVTLKIYDLLGREVATLVDEKLEPGEYKVTFDAGGLASGVYVYRIRAEGFVKSRKLMLLK
jgi:hypothetical protein